MIKKIIIAILLATVIMLLIAPQLQNPAKDKALQLTDEGKQLIEQQAYNYLHSKLSNITCINQNNETISCEFLTLNKIQVNSS